MLSSQKQWLSFSDFKEESYGSCVHNKQKLTSFRQDFGKSFLGVFFFFLRTGELPLEEDEDDEPEEEDDDGKRRLLGVFFWDLWLGPVSSEELAEGRTTDFRFSDFWDEPRWPD